MLRHGTNSGYTYHRCRCEDCRAANRAYREECKSRPITGDEKWHGTAGGRVNYDCKCQACKDAFAALMRKSYHQKKGYYFTARAGARNYRARKRGAAGIATAKKVQWRIEMWGGLCYLCGSPYEALDHVIPLALGGTNWPANLRPICNSCNAEKGGKRLSILTTR